METSRWQARYRVRFPLSSSLARRAPNRGLVVTNPTGIFQLHAWEVETGRLRQVTDNPQGTIFGSISADGRFIFTHTEEAGNEFGHWVRIPFDGGAAESLTPDLPPFASFSLGSSADGRRLGFTSMTPEGIAAVLVDIGPDGTPAAPRTLTSGTSLLAGPLFSANGALAVIMSNEKAAGGLEFSLVAYDAESGERVAELWDGEGTSVEGTTFSPLDGDERILGRSNRSGMNRPFVWNPRTGERTDLNVGTIQGDISAMDWSSDGRRILLGQVHRASQHLHVYDLDLGSARALDHPSGTWGWAFAMGAYFGPNDEIYAHFQDATQPERLVALDAGGNVVRTILPAGDAPSGRPWESISFSSDGAEIQGWVCTPEGDGPFPTILHTHGGPTGVTFESYNPECQAFVDAGFAFCTINYHGSTTFGREFQDSINGDLGRLEVADMVAARNWLVENRVARPDQILLAGASYGGYLTLMGLGLRPDLWAGGMAGVPVCDWKMLYEDSPATRAYAAALLKGTPEDRPEQYAVSAPLTYVDQVQAPVLILYGENDARCPIRQVEAYIGGLRAGGKTVEVYQFEGGHMGSFTNVEEGIREQELMLEFATRLACTPVSLGAS